jgi:hypothetical protein
VARVSRARGAQSLRATYWMQSAVGTPAATTRELTILAIRVIRVIRVIRGCPTFSYGVVGFFSKRGR